MPRNWKDRPEKVAEVVAYDKAHGYRQTLKHFKISSSQLHIWKHKLPAGYYSQRRRERAKANGAEATYTKTKSAEARRREIRDRQRRQMQRVRQRKGNGGPAAELRDSSVLDLADKEALMHLERWRLAYLDRVKAETPSAAEMLATLRGRK